MSSFGMMHGFEEAVDKKDIASLPILVSMIYVLQGSSDSVKHRQPPVAVQGLLTS